LAGVHAAAQFIAARPERTVEFRFFEGHCLLLRQLWLQICAKIHLP
jgi:hypothetical protein